MTTKKKGPPGRAAPEDAKHNTRNHAKANARPRQGAIVDPPAKVHPVVAKELRTRGIDPEHNSWIGLDYATAQEISETVGFTVPCDGLRIPYFDPNGKPIKYTDSKGHVRFYCRFRLLGHYQPPKDKKPRRYVQPIGSPNHLYVPQAPGLNWKAVAKDWETSLYIPEGEFKAIVLALEGYAALAVSGVRSWRTKDDNDESASLPDFSWFNWVKRKTYIVFDTDVDTNRNVAEARGSFGRELFRMHAAPLFLKVPTLPGHAKLGIDDWFKARGKKAVKEFEVLRREAPSPFVLLPKDATDILKLKVPKFSWLCEGLLPAAGLVCLAGFQKRGKSYLGLSLAIAVATGAKALAHFEVKATRQVLYIALEDNDARMQRRLRQLGFTEDAPKNLKIVYAKDMKTGADGYAQIDRWVEDNEGGLVIVDTLQRLRGDRAKRQSGDAYQIDVGELGPLQEMAMRLKFTLLFVTHLRKEKGADPFLQVTGSTGITATCDMILVLDRPFKSTRGKLHMQSRDSGDEVYAMDFDEGVWTYKGPEEATGRTPLQQRILDVLHESGKPHSATELAAAIGKLRESVARALSAMQEEGRVERLEGGRYKPVTKF